MQTDFVTYEHAIELKKLGFTEPCFSFYSKDSDVLCFDVDPDDHTLAWYNQSSVEIRNFSWVYRTSAPLKQQAIGFLLNKCDEIHKGELSIEYFGDGSGILNNYGLPFKSISEAIDKLIGLANDKIV
jgi:hypothetical protein